jgi:ankyrin repeat protein
LAASEGKTDCMSTLLKKNADANARVDGITALMTASVGGHVEAVKLAHNGADPKAMDGDGLTPVMNAAENGTVAVLKLLAENVKEPSYLDIMSSTGFNALIIAAAHGHAKAVEFL